nr:uncharacterized protein LOC104107349 isoform X2 [Nicotiana tomentosiformis]
MLHVLSVPFLQRSYLYLKPYPIAKNNFLLEFPFCYTSKINYYSLEEEMEAEATPNKDMKVEINSLPETPSEIISPTPENFPMTGGLARQGSMTKNSCLCSPTTHAGAGFIVLRLLIQVSRGLKVLNQILRLIPMLI